MTPRSPTVLVLGANGRFGQAAVAAFAQAGWSVLAQVRRASPQPLPAGARALAVPLSDIDTLAAQAAGARAVVHAVNPLYTRWQQELLPAARQGMDVARRLGARFMLPGNVYNFGEHMPALLRPGTPQQPSHAKGRIRCELEAEMRARAASGQRGVVIRAGDFFGSGRGSWFDLVIVKSLAQRKLVYPGPLHVPHAWAYLPDLARAFVAVAASDDLPDFADLHFPGHTLTGTQLLAALERAAACLGIAAPQGWRHGSMPWGLIRAGGVFVPTWRALAEMSYLWRVPHALDGTALAAAVGTLPATPIDAALRAALLDLGLGTGRRSVPAVAA
ncbi:MAG TPA: NAD-dependent epimerase/dehydratase family protein [Rubrivivax sp.]|nr:NAD-dependent epimerase/dehydratase family protein [Rubrivivax sp.]